MTLPRAAAGVLPSLDIGTARDGGVVAPRPALQHWLDADGRLVATGGRDAASWWMHWPGLATYRFGPEGPVVAQPLAPGLDEAITDSFVRGVAPVVMLARGHEALHASAVADGRGVVAFCATSGTGKSTIALAVAAAGLTHWADDTVVYRISSGRPVAVRLPCPARVGDDARHVIDLRGVEEDSAGERPLRRVYLLAREPGIDPSRPWFRPVAARARFERLLAHAHPFDLEGDGRRRRLVESLLAVAAGVDVWECGFAPSLPALPALARAIRAHAEGG